MFSGQANWILLARFAFQNVFYDWQMNPVVAEVIHVSKRTTPLRDNLSEFRPPEFLKFSSLNSLSGSGSTQRFSGQPGFRPPAQDLAKQVKMKLGRHSKMYNLGQQMNQYREQARPTGFSGNAIIDVHPDNGDFHIKVSLPPNSSASRAISSAFTSCH